MKEILIGKTVIAFWNIGKKIYKRVKHQVQYTEMLENPTNYMHGQCWLNFVNHQIDKNFI
jgi:hypothetical protein